LRAAGGGKYADADSAGGGENGGGCDCNSDAQTIRDGHADAHGCAVGDPDPDEDALADTDAYGDGDARRMGRRGDTSGRGEDGDQYGERDGAYGAGALGAGGDYRHRPLRRRALAGGRGGKHREYSRGE
jgi:hypothetical protein